MGNVRGTVGAPDRRDLPPDRHDFADAVGKLGEIAADVLRPGGQGIDAADRA